MEEKEITTEIETEQEKKTYPLVALRGKVLFPKTLLNFDVGRAPSIAAINRAALDHSEIFIAPQKSAFIDNPKKSDILKVGVIARIKQIVKVQSTNTLKVSVEAVKRAKITSFVDTKGFFTVTAEESPYILPENEFEAEAYFRHAKNCFYEYAILDKRISKDMISAVTDIKDVNEFMDNALTIVSLKEKDVQDILELDHTLARLKAFERLFTKELEIAKIERKITSKVRQSIDKSQKEFYLREQLKAIHEELGDDADEIDELTRVIKEKGLPKDVEEKVLKEISRLDKVNPSSPDYSIILNYLDWIKELPFSTSTVDTEDLAMAKSPILVWAVPCCRLMSRARKNIRHK